MNRSFALLATLFFAFGVVSAELEEADSVAAGCSATDLANNIADASSKLLQSAYNAGFYSGLSNTLCVAGSSDRVGLFWESVGTQLGATVRKVSLLAGCTNGATSGCNRATVAEITAIEAEFDSSTDAIKFTIKQQCPQMEDFVSSFVDAFKAATTSARSLASRCAA
jgi:hypothetical protein